MTTIKGYANYGVLAHEKRTIFTVSTPDATATVNEEIEITLPDGWEASENNFGETLINTPEGETYIASDIISSWGDNPALSWYDGSNSHRITLEWRSL